MLSAGVLFSGSDYSSLNGTACIFNLQILGERQYNSIQAKYLFPLVNKKFIQHQADLFIEVQGKEMVLGGDGKCDSPGHSAKYGTYSFMDVESEKIVDFAVVQVTEVRNSNCMELEGFRRCLDHLENEHLTVMQLGTDRHVKCDHI